ncbi:Bcr/CflA family drug resistance efflux transporter [Sphingomonas psychrolutea]|uniref:Bcr/CflA family efflux transporter n=2 Tax=Sphingomonas psychrolutea TaxID=1259676 RepID=A0ABQ1GSP8_9SPHN|nr:Bcr/CflA family drug resistance efflux transporter [Sphingomonas psychrolutea]
MQDSPPIRMVEFVPLIAALMALAALGIDTMLPALPNIAQRLGVDAIREGPLILTVFVIGLGIGQLIHGPLTDRYGRRPVLICGLIAYIIGNLLAGLAGNFTLLLVARFASGLAIASGRVVTIALIRDCFSGRAMAQVTSLAFMVFMAVPIVAPSIGQGILLVGSWRLIFEVIAGGALLCLIWFAVRMPETLKREDRQPLSIRATLAGWGVTASDRYSLGYTLAAMVCQGAIFGYLSSIQPIMAQVFHQPAWLGGVFAASAGTMAAANLLNSRIVMRVGMRRISQAALVVMIMSSSTGLMVGRLGDEPLIVFVVIQAITMACFGLATSNMSAMAMENMGGIAGTASSVQGFVGITFGAVIGWAIGLSFDGTTGPMHGGFLLAGLVGLATAAIVERGRLFRPS